MFNDEFECEDCGYACDLDEYNKYAGVCPDCGGFMYQIDDMEDEMLNYNDNVDL